MNMMRIIRLGLAVIFALGACGSPLFANGSSAPRNLTIWVVGGEVRLSWLAPDPPSGNAQFKLLRRLNTPPTGADDPSADLLVSGTSPRHVDPIVGLLPDLSGQPHVYHYAVFACDAGGGSCETVGSRASLAPSLVECLRGGGYTIFWRHADADVCVDHLELGTAENTTVPNWWRSCDANCTTATARQMNAAGVQHATFIGQQFRWLGVPVGRVISSEFCRCFRTAELMDFGPTIELNSGITFFVYDEANRCTHCYERIREVPAAGTNTAIIGHAGFSPSCPTLSLLAWSECAIFKPDGTGGETLITRLLWDAWGPLATDSTPDEVAAGLTALDTPLEVTGGVRIRYRIGSDVAPPVRLDVFDVRGRRLWSWRPQQQRPGQYEHTWDRRDERGHEVPRGIYFVRLQAGTNAPTRKALILRR